MEVVGSRERLCRSEMKYRQIDQVYFFLFIISRPSFVLAIQANTERFEEEFSIG